MERGRCPACGGELQLRLGDLECAACGNRVLARDAQARQRSADAAPWDPTSAFAAPRAPTEPEAQDAVRQLGLRSGGTYKPRMHDLGSPRLMMEKWVFLAAFFLGNIFVTYAFLNSAGPEGARGVSPGSVVGYVSLSTVAAALVLLSRSGSFKNGCLFLVVGSLILAGFSIYRAASAGNTTLLYGLVVQVALYIWLAAILLRDNEVE